MSRFGTDAAPRILGQLLAAQSIFSVFSTRQRMGEFVCRAVEGIPGVGSCAVCMPGAERPLLGGEPIPECADCDVPEGDIDHDPGLPCRLPSCTGLRFFPLRTQDRRFGFFLLKVNEPEQYASYEPFVSNMIDGLAVNVERQWQKDRLHAANDELLKLRDHLQELVGMRTGELQTANDRLLHLNAVLRSIRGVNQIIVRDGKIEHLAQSICECLIETRCYDNAWIALAEPSGELVPRGMAGTKEVYIGAVKQLGPANDMHCIAAALKHPGVVVVADPHATCSGCALLQEGPGRSAMAIRLEHRGRVFGVLVVSADPKFANDKEEHALLMEMAEDIGLALHSIEQESMRKRADEALRESEVLNRRLVEHLPHRVFVKDRNSVYVSCNATYARDLGIAPEQIAGKDDFAFFPAQLAEAYRADDRTTMETGQKKDIEEQYITVGQERWVHTIKVPYRDEQGNVTGLLGAFEDITARKRAEVALRNSEARYRALLENSADGILMADLETKTFKYANPAVCRMLGYTGEELRTLGVADIHPKEDLQRVIAEFEAQTRGEKTLATELPCLRKDGTILYVDVNAATVVIDRRTCLVGFFRDVTERKRAEAEREKLEAQLRQAQKMDAVGRLAGGVAHDFNNMLQVILGNTDMALGQAAPGSPLGESLLEIQKAAERSADLTRQLLAFARKQTIAPEVLDLNDAVASMLKMLGRLIGEDIDLLWKPASNLGRVKMDPAQLDQILANLAVNARDAIAGVGKVTIETENTEFDEAYCQTHPGSIPGRYVLLAVSDDGCGMDKETLANIFEPFFTTKKAGKGTGLGLATVYGIAKQNDGFINVYSEPGQGTTFRIYLPRLEAETPAEEARRALKEPARGTETVLLVEDEEALLRIGKRLLEQLGYTALTAGAPGEAIRLVEGFAGNIDLLITDIIMPGMSGRDLWDRLSALRPSLKCLFMSGYTANVIAHQSVLEEGVCFLQKPFTMDAFAGKIREALEK